MRVQLFLFLLNSILFPCQGQGVNNLWMMGYESFGGWPFGGVNIDFSNGYSDTSYEFRSMNLNSTNAVICDKNGDLLFYGNGVYIANANNDTMQNGGGLNPGPFVNSYGYYGLPIPQGNLVIPMPQDTNKYYIFHETATSTGPMGSVN